MLKNPNSPAAFDPSAPRMTPAEARAVIAAAVLSAWPDCSFAHVTMCRGPQVTGIQVESIVDECQPVTVDSETHRRESTRTIKTLRRAIRRKRRELGDQGGHGQRW